MAKTTPEGMLIMLFVAAKLGDTDELEKLLSFRAVLVSAANSEGFTTLHIAAANNRLSACELLLYRGADVNAVQPHSRQTPLLIAAQHGHLRICELLVDNGCQ